MSIFAARVRRNTGTRVGPAKVVRHPPLPFSLGDFTNRKCLSAFLALGLLVAAARLAAQPPEVKPGPEHELFKQFEGVWDATIKSHGRRLQGHADLQGRPGGLWLLEHFKGDFGGMPFEGRGATSYDPAKKKYVNVWIDSMSTSPMISEGTYDK